MREIRFVIGYFLKNKNERRRKRVCVCVFVLFVCLFVHVDCLGWFLIGKGFGVFFLVEGGREEGKGKGRVVSREVVGR